MAVALLPHLLSYPTTGQRTGTTQQGHPHSETLEALLAADVEFFGTSENGTVVFYTDGTTYRVEVERESQPRSPPTTVLSSPTASPPAAAPFSSDIVSVTSPVSPGGRATLQATTSSTASCGITVYYKNQLPGKYYHLNSSKGLRI
jgi:hypothetical protein